MNKSKRKFIKQISTLTLLPLTLKKAHSYCYGSNGWVINVDYESCIGCTRCVRACPTDTLLLLDDGKPGCTNPLSCVGCKRCEMECPTEELSIRIKYIPPKTNW